MNSKLNSNDWRNALDAVCRWDPELWGSSIVGHISSGNTITIRDCKESG